MKEQKEVLYYKLIQEHLEGMFGIIYTPTEGDTIQDFSKVFRKPEGCLLFIFDQDRVEDNLAQWGVPENIDYIVVTDGEEVSPNGSSRLDLEKTDKGIGSRHR